MSFPRNFHNAYGSVYIDKIGTQRFLMTGLPSLPMHQMLTTSISYPLTTLVATTSGCRNAMTPHWSILPPLMSHFRWSCSLIGHPIRKSGFIHVAPAGETTRNRHFRWPPAPTAKVHTRSQGFITYRGGGEVTGSDDCALSHPQEQHGWIQTSGWDDQSEGGITGSEAGNGVEWINEGS